MSTASSRSRTRAVLYATLSLVVASVTAWVAWSVVNQYQSRLDEARTIEGTRPVVVAARDLRAGITLGAEDLRMEERLVTADAGHVFTGLDALVGQVVGDSILANEAIRQERLVAGGATPRINEILDPGARAVTIRASRATAVGGLLEPGFYVDVIVTIRPDSDTLSADWVTETILQGVRVLAVGTDVSRSPVEEEGDRKGPEKATTDREPGPTRESWVTLEVEPEEAEQLALGASRGQLHLSLRARDDFQMLANDKPLVTNALVGLSPPVQAAQEKRLERKRKILTRTVPGPPSPPSPVHTTEVIRSGEVTTERFDASGNRIPAPSDKR